MTEVLDIKVEKNGLLFYGTSSEGFFEEWLIIVNLLPSKERIRDGLLLQIGFSIYKLVQLNMDQFRIMSVNYETNPFKEFTDDLTLALWIQAEQIRDLRTAISDVKFVNPTGVHGGLGSTRAHNELLGIIDSSLDYETFVRRLNNWANYRLDGGIASLPEGLRSFGK